MRLPVAVDLILASASPRRRELLDQLGWPCRVEPADIDERPGADEAPLAHVERLARAKARVIAARDPRALVLAADTIVVLDGQILGKPADDADAVRMLRSLSGSTHQVMTGVAVAQSTRTLSEVQTSTVRFRALTEEDIRDYVSSGEPRDKAGAYGIQGPAGRFVEHLSGSYTGVMGLPLCHTERLLLSFLRPEVAHEQ
ncbi:MAG: Maf family protein [Oceanococcaceae bacterium]